MPLDLERIKKRQTETKQMSKGDRWTPPKEGGVCRLRVFKFVHKVTKADIANGHFAKAKHNQDAEELDRPFTFHFGVGADNRPVLSTPELVARYKRLVNSKNKEDQKRAKDLQPQTKYALNVVDTDEKPVRVRYWLTPKTVYNEILGTVLDADYGESVLGTKGRDFVVKYDPAAQGSDKYSTKVRDKDKCAALTKELLAQVIDFYSEEGLEKIGFVEAAGGSEESEDESEVKVEAADEDEPKEDDADEKAEEDDEDEPKSKKKGKPSDDEDDDL